MLVTNALDHEWPLSNVLRRSRITLRFAISVVGNPLEFGPFFCPHRITQLLGATYPVPQRTIITSRRGSQRGSSFEKGNDICKKWPEDKRVKKRRLLPQRSEPIADFVNSCRDKAAVVIIHQDAFAADYQDDEYMLLGKAIKFADSTERKSILSGKTEKRSKEIANRNCCNE